MQTDGNLVVIGPGNVPLWSTRTSGNAGATLELQSDGNLVVYAPGHVARWATGTPDAAGLADRIAAVANAEAADTARNHEAGGTDCNFYTTDLGAGRPCGNGWRAEAWCADFARWVWAHAGARTAGLDAGAVSFRNHAAWTPGASLTGVRVGDVVGYRFDTGTHGDDHVGVVVATAPGTVTTVEGNYSNGVHRVTVTRGWSDITGYARPQTR
jgi:hypothetical protein